MRFDLRHVGTAMDPFQASRPPRYSDDIGSGSALKRGSGRNCWRIFAPWDGLVQQGPKPSTAIPLRDCCRNLSKAWHWLRAKRCPLTGPARSGAERAGGRFSPSMMGTCRRDAERRQREARDLQAEDGAVRCDQCRPETGARPNGRGVPVEDARACRLRRLGAPHRRR